MVISIDAVRYSGKLEATSGGRTEVAEGIADGMRQPNCEVLAPARGVMCGLLLSTALWVGLAAATRAVIMMMR
jgi:formate/nitrite transporter FocA (FNT family)